MGIRHLALAMVGFIVLMVALANWIAPDFVKPKLPADRSHGEALIGGPFEAVNHKGESFTDKDLLGRYSLMYFGFTYCPDICPTSLLIVANAIDSLNSSQIDQVMPVFVSVDPKRDTVEAMASYVQNFHPNLVGVTGTSEQVAQIAKAYKVYYSVVEAENSAVDYLVDHSGFLYLMGPDGKYITHFPHNVSEQVLADALRSHISG